MKSNEILAHIFVKDKEQWNDNGFYLDRDRKLSVREYRNAIVLPLKRKDGAKNGCYAGGVCDENFLFCVGAQEIHDAFSCNGAYEVTEKEIEFVSDEVVFGGVFYEHFGVTVIQALTRLWYIIGGNYKGEKIVFLAQEEKSKNAFRFCEEIARIAGFINYKIITKPTKFSKIIVPDEAFVREEYISSEYFDIYRFLAKKSAETFKDKFEKIYLSRTKFEKFRGGKTDCINEEYYEDFYAKRGFHICHLQDMPLAEQIYLISNAEEIVSTYGTLANFITLFIKDGAKQIMLLRTEKPDRWFCAEAQLLSKRNIDWNIVEATENPLPTWHDGGVFLFAPTEYFKEYLEKNSIEFSKEEIFCDISADKISEFMSLWTRIFSRPAMFKRLESPESFPVLQALYYQSTGKILNPKDYLG